MQKAAKCPWITLVNSSRRATEAEEEQGREVTGAKIKHPTKMGWITKRLVSMGARAILEQALLFNSQWIEGQLFRRKEKS